MMLLGFVLRTFCLVLPFLPNSAAKNALIFDRTPHACAGCDDVMESLLQSCGTGNEWTIQRVTSIEPITRNKLRGYDLYIQPGGDSPGSGKAAFSRAELKAIKAWVKQDGGRYYGSCWGGYAIGNWVFGFIKTGFQPENFVNPDITNGDTSDLRVNVTWRNGTVYETYFQDGPTWNLNKKQLKRVDVLATYTASDHIAAMAFDSGSGKVGATGVHFEGNSAAINSWPRLLDLGCQVVEEIMA